MSIRTIRNVAGAIVGYQAFSGSGGAGLTSYVPAGHRNAQAVLQAAETMLADIHKSLQKPPCDTLTGLRMVLKPGKTAGSHPVLYADAVWRQGGKNVHRCYSTDRHGRLDAVILAMAEMERGTGRPIALAPRAVLAELMSRYETKAGSPPPPPPPLAAHSCDLADRCAKRV